jgi:DNA invertase Pin-like site-specific DNA recombinase
MGRKRKIKPGDPKRAVAYLRVSTERQGLGLAAQRTAIQRWAKLHGIEVLGWFIDEGVSGGLPVEDRPSLRAALAELRTKGAGVLVVAKRDRLARDVLEALSAEREAARNGGSIRSADGNGNGDDADAKLYRTILDAFAERERAVIGRRIKEALAVKKQRGERVSLHAPYGFRFRRGQLVPDAKEQAVMTRIRRLAARGHSTHAIAQRLNEAGVPARGKAWHAMTVYRILKTGEER